MKFALPFCILALSTLSCVPNQKDKRTAQSLSSSVAQKTTCQTENPDVKKILSKVDSDVGIPKAVCDFLNDRIEFLIPDEIHFKQVDPNQGSYYWRHRKEHIPSLVGELHIGVEKDGLHNRIFLPFQLRLGDDPTPYQNIQFMLYSGWSYLCQDEKFLASLLEHCNNHDWTLIFWNAADVQKLFDLHPGAKIIGQLQYFPSRADKVFGLKGQDVQFLHFKDFSESNQLIPLHERQSYSSFFAHFEDKVTTFWDDAEKALSVTIDLGGDIQWVKLKMKQEDFENAWRRTIGTLEIHFANPKSLAQFRNLDKRHLYERHPPLCSPQVTEHCLAENYDHARQAVDLLLRSLPQTQIK